MMSFREVVSIWLHSFGRTGHPRLPRDWSFPVSSLLLWLLSKILFVVLWTKYIISQAPFSLECLFQLPNLVLSFRSPSRHCPVQRADIPDPSFPVCSFMMMTITAEPGPDEVYANSTECNINSTPLHNRPMIQVTNSTPILQIRPWGTKRLSNLPKDTTTWATDKASIWTQEDWF